MTPCSPRTLFRPRRPLPALCLAASLVVSAAVGAAWATPGAPAPVSPGSPEAVTAVAATCPTFSWTYTPAAEAVELAVYRLDPAAAAVAPEEAPPVLEHRLPAGAVSWTPSTERCLEPGARYAWFVRFETESVPGPWSEGALFQVLAPPAPARPTEQDAASEDRLSRGATTESILPTLPPVIDAGAPASPRPRANERRTVPTQPSKSSFQASGHVSIGGAYRFTEPRKLVYVVPASAFRPRTNQEPDQWRLERGYGYTPTIVGEAGDIPLTAPLLDLPDGAKIVGFRCLVYDAVELDEASGEPDVDDLAIGMSLDRHRRFGAASERIALAPGVTDGESLLVRTVDARTFEPSVVDRERYSYLIDGLYNSESEGESLRFYGCELDLEIGRIDPR